ncbi:MAG: pyrroline-5-carboxylate reductase, partial [Candidatus Omnitrophica bacterium]|nr:pyrroline-5-carboxylate reductase [Candidatus Omnitrophota bacterium]
FILSDRDTDKLKKLKKSYVNIRIASSNHELVDKCSAIILAVKPQQIEELMREIGRIQTHKLFISIAAGVKLNYLRRMLGKKAGLIRVMPNTPALVGEGMIALSRGSGVSAGEWRLAGKIFSSLGKTIQVEEKKMGMVTAISGSGPAYFFYMIEGMVEAGKRGGLSEKEALTLASKTASGSAKLLAQSQSSPEELRKQVTSKGGTTEAAINVFEKMGFKKILKEGITAAARRSREMEGRRC